MDCNEARRLVVTGAGWPGGRGAKAHARECAACAEWFADVDEMAELLRTVPTHDLPETLNLKLQKAAQTYSSEADASRNRTTTRFTLRRMKMRRSVLLAASFALAAGIGFFTWAPGGRSVAVADLRKGLIGVFTVHMTGEDQGYRKNKWLRSKPFAVYELSTAEKAEGEKRMQHYLFAGNPQRTYWYFPDWEKRGKVGKGLPRSFFDEMMSVLQPNDSEVAELTVVGHIRLDGRDLTLLEDDPDGHKEPQSYMEELAFDQTTKRAYRIRQFKTDATGKQVEVTNLKLDYNGIPPQGIFEWKLPADAKLISSRKP